MKVNIYITTHDFLAASRGAALLGMSLPAAVRARGESNPQASCRPLTLSGTPQAHEAAGGPPEQPYMPTTTETPTFD